MARMMLKKTPNGELVEVPYEYNLITEVEKHQAVFDLTVEIAGAVVAQCMVKGFQKIAHMARLAALRMQLLNVVSTRAVRTFDPRYCDG